MKLTLNSFKKAIADRFLSLPVGIGLWKADQIGDSILWPEEIQAIGEKAYPKRKLDFTLGRMAAREALHELRHSPVPIPRGERGEPIWPGGIVGSITHSCGTAVAIAGDRRNFRTIGVDLESIDASLSLRSMKLICVDDEMEWVISGEMEDAKLRLIQLFSAKEAIYKAFYPLVRTELTFKDAYLRWDENAPNGGGFTARLNVQGVESTFYVHSIFLDLFVFSWISIKSN